MYIENKIRSLELVNIMIINKGKLERYVKKNYVIC